jgi:hypothetical protein
MYVVYRVQIPPSLVTERAEVRLGVFANGNQYCRTPTSCLRALNPICGLTQHQTKSWRFNSYSHCLGCRSKKREFFSSNC